MTRLEKKMQLVYAIKLAMLTQNVSIPALATKTGVHRNVISKVLSDTNQNVSLELLFRVCEQLGLDLQVAISPTAQSLAPQTAKQRADADERAEAITNAHHHTGKPAVDLAEIEARRVAKGLPPHPPKFVGKKANELNWIWEEWARLRMLCGMAPTDNMGALSQDTPQAPLAMFGGVVNNDA